MSIDKKNKELNNQNQIDENSTMFTLELDYKKYFKEGSVNKNLIKIFSDKGFPISDNAVLLKKDEKIWVIKDENKLYILKDIGNELEVKKIKGIEFALDEKKDEKEKSEFFYKISSKFEKLKKIFKIERKEMTEKEEFITSTISHFAILLFIVLVVDIAIKYYMSLSENSLYPLQVFEAKVVYYIQSLLGFPVELVDSTTLRYNNSDIVGLFPNQKIGPECTGFHEAVFIMLLVLGFKYISWKTKIIWAFILGVVMFVENIVRIVMLYPIAVWKGARWEDKFHYYFWHYGQYMIVMTLFILWFLFVARKEACKYFEQNGKKKEKAVEMS